MNKQIVYLQGTVQDKLSVLNRKFDAQNNWKWKLQDFHIKHALQARQGDGRSCGVFVCLVSICILVLYMDALSV